MVEFETHQKQAADICIQIERNMIALGIDWHDEVQLQALAQDALGETFSAQTEKNMTHEMLKTELYGLIELMTRTMEEGAESGIEVHGNDMWKALAKALWVAKGSTDSK